MNPTVSVLFPIYKTAPFLKEAVDSLMNQSFTDFELIALDDCSPDNAEEILDSYHDHRIVRYKGDKNVGLANVLNVGFGLAKGKYIARMDSDDISLPERLMVEVNYLEKHPDVDLVSCGMREFGGGDREYSYQEDFDYLKFSSFLYTPVLHPTTMWRKESFREMQLLYNQEMVPAEDYDLWTRALLSGLKLINIPDILYLYRIHGGQATQCQIDRVIERTSVVAENYFSALFEHLSDDELSLLLYLNKGKYDDMKKLKNAVALLQKKNDEINFVGADSLKEYTGEFYKKKLYTYCLTNKFGVMDMLNLGFYYSSKLLKNRLLR